MAGPVEIPNTAWEHAHFPTIVPEVSSEAQRFLGEVFTQLFRLITENLGLLFGLTGLVICVIVARLFFGLVAGKSAPVDLAPLPGNSESVYRVPGSQGSLF